MDDDEYMCICMFVCLPSHIVTPHQCTHSGNQIERPEKIEVLARSQKFFEQKIEKFARFRRFLFILGRIFLHVSGHLEFSGPCSVWMLCFDDRKKSEIIDPNPKSLSQKGVEFRAFVLDSGPIRTLVWSENFPTKCIRLELNVRIKCIKKLIYLFKQSTEANGFLVSLERS